VSTSTTEFLDGIDRTLRETLAALDRETLPEPEPSTSATIPMERLQGSLDNWQTMLDDMADHVSAASDELNALDSDLKRALDSFTVARKYLENVREKSRV
jgi:hypothetical protein